MLRVLLSARWVGYTLLLIAAVGVCGRLGVWQWDRANPDPVSVDPAQEASSSLPAVLDRLEIDPDIPAGALVRGSGRYDTDPSATTTIPKDLDGRAGEWVLTPLVLDDDREVLVLRGWAPSGTDAQTLAPVDADVVVTGRFEPPGSVEGVDELFVAVTAQQPTGDENLTRVPFPAAEADADVKLLNALYALQWWTFAVFWVWLWWRMLREDVAAAREVPPAVHPSATT